MYLFKRKLDYDMIHQEFLYRLKLPPLEEVLLSSDILNPYVEKLSSGSKIFYPEPKDIFKPNWLRFKNVNWDYLSLFVRSGKEHSILHRDNPHSPNSLHWGINWIHGDDSVMKYWNENDIQEEKIIYDNGGKTTAKLITDSAPSKIYNLTSGAYLVNASVPHQVINFSSNIRIALSLRSKQFRYDNPLTTWPDVIELFKNEIDVNKEESFL